MTPIRAYRWVQSRWVHYRAAGEGPLVVLLHGSPQSGAALAGILDALVDAGCSAIALDTPGNGCSDALPGDPDEVHVYARALAETLDSLGVRRAAFYGFHTGAAHAAAFAGLFPQRVSALALDGFPVWTEAERADLLANYLPPFAPAWDGSHLTWAWARMEAQSIFFPWYARTDTARMPRHAVPDTAIMHENVLDLLRAGDRYRAPYASAFRCHGQILLEGIAAPTLLCAGARDPLAAHLDRVTAPAANIEVRRHGLDRPPAWADIAHWLAAHAREPAPPWPQSGVDDAGVARHTAARLRVYEHGDGRPIVLIPARGESIEAAMPRALSVADRRMVVVERPLHGESGDGDVRQAIETMGLRDAEVVAGESPAPPSVTPRWDGAHLATAWRFAWRAALFDPWDAPDAVHARRGAPDIESVHARAVDLLKAWRALG